jgi:excisionase family DNA binding protein
VGKEEKMEKLLNINEASELLGLAKATLYRYASMRMVPAIKLGDRLLFKQSDLEKWIDDHRIEPNAFVAYRGRRRERV